MTKVNVLSDITMSVFFQAIDYIVQEMQKEFNKERGTVFNTYQCYLKGSMEHIASDLDRARKGGYYFAGKLVRGAYMVAEREIAKENGYPSPIHDCKSDTDANYDRYISIL